MVKKITIKGCSDEGVLSEEDITLKISQVIEKFQNAFSDASLGNLVYREINISGVDSKNWFTNGIDCEILEPGTKGWQKGKIRLQVNVEVEFIPSEAETTEAESPLDDLREKLQEGN